MTFSSFIGNSDVKNNLASSIKNRFPQVTLLTGPEGSGKFTLAKIIASALLCESNNPPCDRCNSCHKINENIHPDVTVIDNGLNDIKIDTARFIKNDCHILPNESNRKVYIIRHSQNLNVQAQNVLLKSLEEPPSFTFFILTAENESSLLQTILSRTIKHTVSPVSSQEILNYLKSHFPNTALSLLETIADNSSGIIGNALTLIQDKTEVSNIVSDFAAALSSRNELLMYKALVPLEKLSRKECGVFFTSLKILLHDAILISKNVSLSTVLFKETSLLSSSVQSDNLISFYDFVCNLEEKIPLNINISLLISALCAGAYEICYAK